MAIQKETLLTPPQKQFSTVHISSNVLFQINASCRVQAGLKDKAKPMLLLKYSSLTLHHVLPASTYRTIW